MDNQKQIDDIISMLDSFVENGGGHMNIKVPDPSTMEQLTIETYNSTDCVKGNTACSVPTLHKGIDDDE